MDWDEQKRRAMEVLKDPGAEEQQWLDACDEIGSRKTVPYPALSKILYWPIAMVVSFGSGIASIVTGLVLGSAIVACIYVLSMMPVAGCRLRASAAGIPFCWWTFFGTRLSNRAMQANSGQT
jgi:hypothetical protein